MGLDIKARLKLKALKIKESTAPVVAAIAVIQNRLNPTVIPPIAPFPSKANIAVLNQLWVF